MRRLADFSLALPPEWFSVPLDPTVDIVEWATETAYRAWRLRADAGVPEDAVAHDAGRRLVVELAGLAHNLREQLGGSAVGSALVSAWLPIPELGVVSAVVIVQAAERSVERSPERFAATLEELTQSPEPGAGYLHTARLEGDLRSMPLRGLHSMVGLMDPEAGVAVLEERTCFGVFPEGADAMVEVLFVAERPASFEDMPAQTRELLEGLEVSLAEAA
ncbi:MAG: hypothetical protein GX593_05410 [Actinomycetales bacterium]|nr:hypothetical protein [Actinomycetales bacterium]